MLGVTEPVADAVELLRSCDALLVLDDGKPVGVLTRQDLLSDINIRTYCRTAASTRPEPSAALG